MQRKSAYLLFVAVLGLLVIGIVMLFSTSAFAKDSHGDAYFFLKRQSLWLGVGLTVCIATALVDYHFWQRLWWVWLAIAAITLVFCFVPHIGMRINGSRRWIGLGPIGFQPSEIAKLAAVFFLAWWFARYEKVANHPLFGFAIPLAIVSALLALILFEVDLGTTALIGATTFAIMFVAGTNPILLGLVAITGGSVRCGLPVGVAGRGEHRSHHFASAK